ncbi:MAG: prolipoprotein diacylglyceryl transferase, partial [Brevibacterium aurantiacum]
WESIRLDPSFVVLGLRTNVWAAIGAVALGIAIIVVQKMRHPEPEKSPFINDRKPEPEPAD